MESAPRLVYPDLAMFCPPDKVTADGVDRLDETRAAQEAQIKSVLTRKLSDYSHGVRGSEHQQRPQNVGASDPVRADIGVPERERRDQQ